MSDALEELMGLMPDEGWSVERWRARMTAILAKEREEVARASDEETRLHGIHEWLVVERANGNVTERAAMTLDFLLHPENAGAAPKPRNDVADTIERLMARFVGEDDWAHPERKVDVLLGMRLCARIARGERIEEIESP